MKDYQELETTAIDEVLDAYPKKIQDKGLTFELSRDEIAKLITSNCHYCNFEPGNRIGHRGDLYVFCGITRLDLSKGYVSNNVASCCIFCHGAKDLLSHDEYIQLVHGIASRWELEPNTLIFVSRPPQGRGNEL